MLFIFSCFCFFFFNDTATTEIYTLSLHDALPILERPELPETIRGESKLVLDEIGRLSSKLNQLLQFSRPAIRGGGVQARCDAPAIIEEVAGVLRHEAERRGVALQVRIPARGVSTAAAADAVSDIVSNLVVDALE